MIYILPVWFIQIQVTLNIGPIPPSHIWRFEKRSWKILSVLVRSRIIHKSFWSHCLWTTNSSPNHTDVGVYKYQKVIYIYRKIDISLLVLGQLLNVRCFAVCEDFELMFRMLWSTRQEFRNALPVHIFWTKFSTFF